MVTLNKCSELENQNFELKANLENVTEKFKMVTSVCDMSNNFTICEDEDSAQNELKQENIKLFELATKAAETLETKLDLITELQKELHYLRN